MTPEQIRHKIVKREQWIKLIMVSLILIVSLTILLAVPGMLVSFLLAFVITYLSKPSVNYLERKGMSRTISVLIPFLILIILVTAISGVMIPKAVQQLSAFQTELPKYVKGVGEIVRKHTHTINSALAPFTKVDISESAANWLEGAGNKLIAIFPNWLGQFFTTLILAPFFAFFMLRDGRTISRELLSLVPNNLFEIALNFL